MPDGFYWVRYHGELMVAHRDGGDWYLTDSDSCYEDADFEAIGEMLTPPEDL